MICVTCGREVNARHWYRASGKPRCWRRKWTRARDFKLMGMWEQGASYAEMAAVFGTNAEAVRLHCKRIGLTQGRTNRSGITAREAQRLLGFRCAKKIVDLIERGYLRAKRAYREGLHQTWFITEQAIRDYLANPAHWHDWQPDRITDPELRRYAMELRGDVRFLNQGEAAALVGVNRGTIRQWIDKGWLPASRLHGTGNHLVRADHVEQIAARYVYGEGAAGMVAA